MREIKAEPISREGFAPFGCYYDMLAPDGYALTGELHCFYPDRISESYVGRAGFSAITVRKPEIMKVEAVEYHTTTSEIIMALNDDMVVHVAPASAGTPVTHLTKAFVVPKGTMVKLNAAIWHLAPLPVHESALHALIVLTECTYVNDCTVVPLKNDEQFVITL